MSSEGYNYYSFIWVLSGVLVKMLSSLRNYVKQFCFYMLELTVVKVAIKTVYILL